MFTKQCSVDYVNGSAQLQRSKCKNYYAFEIFKGTFSSFKSRPLLVLNQRHRGKCQGVQSWCFGFCSRGKGGWNVSIQYLIFLVVDIGEQVDYIVFEITPLRFRV